MGARIASISVTGLGPISSLNWAFKDVNLVYGKNEQGKTFLVEYILHSIFKNIPETRELTESGQVIVSGIRSTPISFNPRSKQKAEDLLFPHANVPFDLGRLCVVRGGDLSLSSKYGDTVTKSILKGYLSDQVALDKIFDKVPAVVRESVWRDGVIIPTKQMGLIKSLNEAIHLVEKLNELLTAVNDNYSQGQAKNAQIELEKVERLISQQYRAKRIYAFKLATQIANAEAELSAFPEDLINHARQTLDRINELNRQIDYKKQQIDELKSRVEYYSWLKSAIDECEKRPEGLKKDSTRIFVYLTIAFIVLAIAAAFLKPYLSLGLGMLSLVFFVLMIRRFQESLTNNAERQDVLNIFAEFESRFGKKAKSIATLKSEFEIIQPLFFKVENFKNDITRLEEDLSAAEFELDQDLISIGRKKKDENAPESIIERAQENRKKINDRLVKLRNQLAAMNVEPSDYLDEPSEFAYDAIELKRLESTRDSLKSKIDQENLAIQSLKQRICDQTRDPITIGWDDLIDHLKKKYEQALLDCKSLHAQVLSGILVTAAVSDLRKQEDEQIGLSLCSSCISDPIKALTPNYSGVELDGEELIAFNETRRFRLGTLSTGAKEQILLALRIGLAEHVLGEQKMFLILDDAFQHSDWDRRERLVDEMAALAQIGWQIIYFTMDDHIRTLFENRIKPKMLDRYQLLELSN